MKKLLCSIMCVVLAMGALSLVGCGSVFDGNYKEMTLEEATAFSATVNQVEDAEEIDYATGVEYTLKGNMETRRGEDTMKVSADVGMKIGSKDGKLQMQGNMNVSSNDNSVIDSDIYFADGYMYYALEMKGLEVKTKAKMSIDKFIRDNVPFGSINISMSGLVEAAGYITAEEGSIKFFMDKSEDYTKIKVVQTAVSGNRGEVILVFNASNQLIAAKVESKIDQADEEHNYAIKGEIYLEIAPWEGTVKLPSSDELGLYIGF